MTLASTIVLGLICLLCLVAGGIVHAMVQEIGKEIDNIGNGPRRRRR